MLHFEHVDRRAYVRIYAIRMSLLRYHKPKDGLPHPKGSLSTVLPSQAIAQANLEVQAAQMEKKRRGPCKRYSPSVQAKVHMVTANAQFSVVALSHSSV